MCIRDSLVPLLSVTVLSGSQHTYIRTDIHEQTQVYFCILRHERMNARVCVCLWARASLCVCCKRTKLYVECADCI